MGNDDPFRFDAPVAVIPLNGSEPESTENKVLQMISDSSKNERSNNTKESALEAEVKAGKQRELISYETRIKQFHEMLAEKQVSSIEEIFIEDVTALSLSLGQRIRHVGTRIGQD